VLCPLVDLSLDSITPPAEETFWEILGNNKVKYRVEHNPTRCKIHDEGPVQEAGLPLVIAELLRLTKREGEERRGDTSQRREQLVAEKRALESAIQLYHLHLRQYETQRMQIEHAQNNLLRPGVDMLYRDYVNDHDGTGGKICNLQLVLVERKVVGGPLALTNIENFADAEACDSLITADIFDFHLGKKDHHHPGLLDHLDTIYLCGDHGPHLSSNNTILNESSFYRKYGKTIHAIFSALITRTSHVMPLVLWRLGWPNSWLARAKVLSSPNSMPK